MSDGKITYVAKVYFSRHDDDWVSYTTPYEPQVFSDGSLEVRIAAYGRMTYAPGGWHHVYVVTEGE